jgi:hypothetical protein
MAHSTMAHDRYGTVRPLPLIRTGKLTYRPYVYHVHAHDLNELGGLSRLPSPTRSSRTYQTTCDSIMSGGSWLEWSRVIGGVKPN